MKKRLVAVTLGVILSLSTVGEAGASVFSSPEDTAASQDEIAGSEAAESETDSAETADTSEVQPEDSGAEDLFSAGEYAGTSDAEPQDSSSAFSSGEDETQPAAVSQITDAVPAEQQDDSDAVSVKAEDWIREDDHFKLRKPVKKDSADTSDAAPADTVQTEDQTGEVVLTDSDTDETDNADSTDPTQADAADTEILTAEDPDYEDAADTTEDPVLDVSDDSADGDANASTDPADNTDSFYTAADGLVKISTEYKEQVHTGWYLFDENGYMVTGQAQVNPEQGTDIAAAQTADASDGDASIAADTEETESETETVEVAKQLILHIGSQNEDGDYYAALDGSKEVHVVSGDTIKELVEKKAADFTDNTILSGSLNNAKGIDVAIGSDSWHLVKQEVAKADDLSDSAETEAETEEKWYAGDTEIALTDLSSAYSDLSGMSAEKILDTAAKSTGDAAISVTVKWEDDTETTVSFTVYDSSFHLAEINGEARKLVNKRDVEKLVEDMTALLKK